MMSMTCCEKCGAQAARTYECEHTHGHEYCKECYEELHYDLTEE